MLYPTRNISGAVAAEAAVPRPGNSGFEGAQSAGNQRGWPQFSAITLVGTPETTRAATEAFASTVLIQRSLPKKELSLEWDLPKPPRSDLPEEFCQWLAGLIDGGGSLEVTQQGFVNLEITLGVADKPLLMRLRSRLGCGSLKSRGGGHSYRYRLHQQSELFWLLPQLDGWIRHSTRLGQYHRAARALGFRVLETTHPLEPYNPWYAGFFDARGHVMLLEAPSVIPRLVLWVGQKRKPDLEPFRALGGQIGYNPGSGGFFV